MDVEHLTSSGAAALATRIRDHWAERGFAVETSVEAATGPKAGNESRNIFCIRSDMVGGMPVRRLAKAPKPSGKVLQAA